MKRDTQGVMAFLLTVKRDTGGANNQISEKLWGAKHFMGFLVNSETRHTGGAMGSEQPNLGIAGELKR